MTDIEPVYSLMGKRVWVAGHRGMVGAALLRRLAQIDCTLITVSRDELDLRRQADVEVWIKRERPQAVFLAAAKVGGIVANDGGRPSFFMTISPSPLT
jgi:GDP-L-fucose synthase